MYFVFIICDENNIEFCKIIIWYKEELFYYVHKRIDLKIFFLFM